MHLISGISKIHDGGRAKMTKLQYPTISTIDKPDLDQILAAT